MPDYKVVIRYMCTAETIVEASDEEKVEQILKDNIENYSSMFSDSVLYDYLENIESIEEMV